MADIVTQLELLGFGKYEALAYMALLRRSPLNGYELARLSSVPRANIYSVLARLEERGAVLRIDQAGSTEFVPVSPSELTQRLSAGYLEALSDALKSLDELAAPIEHPEVLNAQGYQPMQEHASALIDGARENLLLALWRSESRALSSNVSAAAKRGVDVTTLCLENCAQECGYCQGHIFRYSVVPKQNTRWLIVVSDGQELLCGEIGRNDDAQSVRTRQRLLVDLARWYVRHTIALAAVIDDLGGRLDSLLKPETRAILNVVGPDSQAGGWLTHMQALMGRKGSSSAK